MFLFPLYSQLNISWTPNEDGLHYIGWRIQGTTDPFTIASQTGISGTQSTYSEVIGLNTYCGDITVEYWVVPECGYNPEILPPTHPSAEFGTVLFV